MSNDQRSSSFLAVRFVLAAFITGVFVFLSTGGAGAQRVSIADRTNSEQKGGGGEKGFVPSDTGTGAVNLATMNIPVTENFDSLSNTAGSTTNATLPTGWYITETGGGARDNEQYAVDTGASTTGDTYSYGAAAATDRALGGLRSGTLIPNFGAKFTNNTGSTVTSLAVAYTGEEWRLGTTGRTDQLNLEISTDATDLTTGTWTNVVALDFISPDTSSVGAKDGNSAADRKSIGTIINGLNITAGASFFIRWTDIDATGADDGLAVDDFIIVPRSPTAADVSVAGRVTTAEGRGIRNARIVVTGNSLSEPIYGYTGAYGQYTIAGLEAGETYVITVNARRFTFQAPSRVISVVDNVSDADFVGDPGGGQ